MNAVQNKERKLPATSVTMVGFGQLLQGFSGGIWKRKNLYRGVKVHLPELFEQTTSGNVCFTYLGIGNQDNNTNPEGCT